MMPARQPVLPFPLKQVCLEKAFMHEVFSLYQNRNKHK